MFQEGLWGLQNIPQKEGEGEFKVNSTESSRALISTEVILPNNTLSEKKKKLF